MRDLKFKIHPSIYLVFRNFQIAFSAQISLRSLHNLHMHISLNPMY